MIILQETEDTKLYHSLSIPNLAYNYCNLFVKLDGDTNIEFFKINNIIPDDYIKVDGTFTYFFGTKKLKKLIDRENKIWEDIDIEALVRVD